MNAFIETPPAGVALSKWLRKWPALPGGAAVPRGTGLPFKQKNTHHLFDLCFLLVLLAYAALIYTTLLLSGRGRAYSCRAGWWVVPGCVGWWLCVCVCSARRPAAGRAY